MYLCIVLSQGGEGGEGSKGARYKRRQAVVVNLAVVSVVIKQTTPPKEPNRVVTGADPRNENAFAGSDVITL